MATTWKVRYIDYPGQYKKCRTQLLDALDRTLMAGDVMLRQQLKDFEAHLASYVGTKHALGISNCTDALQLALRAANVGPGDEVITVSHTMTATAAAIHHNGASPVLVDIGEDHTMSMDAMEAAITPKTRAIIPVHLNGRICDMDRLMKVAQSRGLVVVEDAAQALGARYKGKRAGSFGFAGCFSFYPAKILGTYGDGGGLTTNSDSCAEMVSLLRNHGRTPDGDTAFWAFNMRLDNIHAVILDLKMQFLDDWIKTRRNLARVYHEELSKVPQVKLPPAPVEEGPYFDVFQNYEIEGEDRDRLVKHLNAQGVEVLIPWGGKAVHQFPKLGLSHFKSKLPRTELFFTRALMVPMQTEISENDVRYVCQVIKDFYKK